MSAFGDFGSFFADMGENPFLLTGLLAGLLASLACGIVGPWVVTRRIVFLAGAIAHMALGGIGASVYLAYRFPDVFGRLDPLTGAAVFSVLAALLLAWTAHRVEQQLDTLIGALWAIGMAAGILLIKFTPGYQAELMSYLFGNLTLVSWESLRLLLLLDLVIVVAALLFHKRFLAVSLDPEHADLQGIDVLRVNAALLVLVALTVITLTQIVGLILVIALLSLPAAAAARFAPRLAGVIGVAIPLCILLTTVPRIAVYGSAISPEPAIVLAAGGVYLLSVLLAARRRGTG